MAKSTKNKKRPLMRLTNEVPEDLRKFLSKEQLLVLRCYLSNFTYMELTSRICLGWRNRSDGMDALMKLGQVLALYRILECDLIPEDLKSSGNPAYLRGWTDCKKAIWRLIKNEESRWQTIKARNSGTPGKSKRAVS